MAELRRICVGLVGVGLGMMARAGEPRPATAPVIFDIKNYGAVTTDGTLNTDAIQKAIDSCSAGGGGRVVIGEGTYLTGPIHLKSHVDLHLDKGATVQFTRKFDDYPLVLASFEGQQTVECTSPISGENLENISITGEGKFDGGGDAWRPVKREKLTDEQWDALVKSGGVTDKSTWYPSEMARSGQAGLRKLRQSNDPPKVEDYVKYRDLLRPALMLLSNCHDVVLDGPTFRNSPGWNLHLFSSDSITIKNVTVFNEYYAQNGDGMDIDSCRDVTVSGCTVDAGDDAICLKSGKDEQGRKLNKPTENVTVTNCTIGHGHGGITIGSEMSGGVRHVNVSHCVLNGTDGGLRFKTTRGRGGIVEDINISDIRMSNIKQGAIEFNMYYMVKNPQAEPVSERTPRFRDFHISNIMCDSAAVALNLHGLPEMPIEGITIENSKITAQQPGQIVDGKNITLKDVEIHTAEKVRVEDVKNLVTQDVVGVAGGAQ